MKPGQLIKIIIPTLAFFLSSCTATRQQNVDIYYSIPTVSYLRESPSYDSRVVTEIYNADQVKILGKNDGGWWQVQSTLDQKIGWTQRDLLSEAPLPTKNYYVAADGVPLRDSPNQDVVSRKRLGHGDEVQKIDAKDGWWRVLVVKDKSMGWIPAPMASANRLPPGQKAAKPVAAVPETPPASRPANFFVAAENLKLYLIPSASSQVVKVLKLNDPVEKLSQSGSGWVKVRYRQTGVEGWTLARYLRDTPLTEKNQIVTDRKKSPPKTIPSGQRTPPPDSESLEPEGM